MCFKMGSLTVCVPRRGAPFLDTVSRNPYYLFIFVILSAGIAVVAIMTMTDPFIFVILSAGIAVLAIMTMTDPIIFVILSAGTHWPVHKTL